MERFLSILRGFKDIFWVVVVLVLLVIIQFKNGAIKRLTEEVSAKPVIEYVYEKDTMIVTDTLVEPYEVVKWKNRIVIETDTVPILLTEADSAQIAKAYTDIYAKYNEINIYKDTLKNDSAAFVQLNEKVTRNSIFDREFIYLDKTPTVYITNTVHKQDKTISLVGGLSTNIGKETNTVSMGMGIVAPSNRVYLFSYDPVNKGFGGAVYLPIFNIRK